MLRRHETGLLYFSQHKISNAWAEFQQRNPTHQGKCTWVSQLHQLQGKDFVSLRQVGFGLSLMKKSQ